MSPPAYHLRPNKAVDRFSLVEAIGRLGKLGELSDYTYYSLGGPYLEDLRLVYEFYPKIQMVSIEENPEIIKRQKIHVPCCQRKLQLIENEFSSFLACYEANDKKSIFWLDYTALNYGCYEEFMTLLGKVAQNSMIKITLYAEPGEYRNKEEQFRLQFGEIMPDSSISLPRAPGDFARLLQDMIQIAAQKVLSSSTPMVFQPVSSFYYSDGTKMFTLTGVVCLRDGEDEIKDAFRSWDLVNLTWEKPKKIDLPNLSAQERFLLQKYMPCHHSDVGRFLRDILGYHIEDKPKDSEFKLQQYAHYHRYFPYFMKTIP